MAPQVPVGSKHRASGSVHWPCEVHCDIEHARMCPWCMEPSMGFLPRNDGRRPAGLVDGRRLGGPGLGSRLCCRVPEGPW